MGNETKVMHISRSRRGYSLYDCADPPLLHGPTEEEMAGLLVGSVSGESGPGTTPDDLANWAEEEFGVTIYRWWRWRAASGAPGGRYHVKRYRRANGVWGENLKASNGRVRTFATYEGAERAAAQANRETWHG